MIELFNPGGVREDAREKVARHIRTGTWGRGERVYLGLPHAKWADFHVIKKICNAVKHGFGIERSHDVFEQTAVNCPDWCTPIRGNITRVLKHTKLRVNCGWIDMMGQVTGKDYQEMLHSIPRVLDTRFKTIPMSFTWLSARDTVDKIPDSNWQFSEENMHVARACYLVDSVQTKEWTYEPLEIFKLREASCMKVVNGLFKRKHAA